MVNITGFKSLFTLDIFAYSCYGNQNASTPAIDKLAEERVRFTYAFSTGTVCSSKEIP